MLPYLFWIFGQVGLSGSVDSDQTITTQAVWLGSTLYAVLSVIVDASKDCQTELVNIMCSVQIYLVFMV